jgi:hypothetical protein
MYLVGNVLGVLVAAGGSWGYAGLGLCGTTGRRDVRCQAASATTIVEAKRE